MVLPKNINFCLRQISCNNFAIKKASALRTPIEKTSLEKIYRMLCEIITPESKRTKGALINYVRDNFKEPTIYADVGRVASKIIKTHTTGRFAQWGFVTTARHVRAI